MGIAGGAWLHLHGNGTEMILGKHVPHTNPHVPRTNPHVPRTNTHFYHSLTHSTHSLHSLTHALHSRTPLTHSRWTKRIPSKSHENRLRLDLPHRSIPLHIHLPTYIPCH